MLRWPNSLHQRLTRQAREGVAGAAEPNHREGVAGERAELPERSEPEVPAEPEVQPELRLAAAGEELPEPTAQQELAEAAARSVQEAGAVHWRSPRAGAAAGCQLRAEAREPGPHR